MELSDSAQQDLGIDWQVLRDYSAGTSGDTTLAYGKENRNTQFKDDGGNSYQSATSAAFTEIPGVGLGGGPIVNELMPTEFEDTQQILTSVLSADDVTALSKLPSKPELQAKLLGTMNAVPTGLVQVLSGVPRSFLNVLQAINEQKEN